MIGKTIETSIRCHGALQDVDLFQQVHRKRYPEIKSILVTQTGFRCCTG